MAANFPHITISFAHNRDGSDATGELNTLTLGFGLFLTWAYVSIFGSQAIFDTSSVISDAPILSMQQTSLIAIAYMAMSGLALLFIGVTNQKFLKFYVSKWATIATAVLGAIGTVLIAAIPFVGTPLAILSGALMGVSASLAMALWGTCFARYEFTTIILNSIVAVVVGVLLYVGLTHWVIAPLSGILTAILPIAGSMILWKLTPVPYYLRNEIPIFHPLAVRKTPFALRFGLPAVILGFSLGAVRRTAFTCLLPSSDLTTQLIVGLAAGISVLVIVFAVAAARDESHWDSIFRVVIPIVAAAIFFIPQLGTELNLLSCFIIAGGVICFEALVWIFYSDLAQEFRLSPIYVFGLGRGMLAFGALISYLTLGDPASAAGVTPIYTTEQSFFLMLILVIGYALLPRKRDIRRLLMPIPPHKDGTDHIRKSIEDHVEGATAKPADGDNNSGESPAANSEDDSLHTKGRFHTKCEEIADRYLLSRRETEVMFLLAKGHNAAFIQDKLCISKSTAKTHINHIYRKLDIHTQQELLNMMEEEEPEPQVSSLSAKLGTVSHHMKPAASSKRAKR